MKNLYPHLLSPLRVGPLTYRNRVVSAPEGGSGTRTRTAPMPTPSS